MSPKNNLLNYCKIKGSIFAFPKINDRNPKNNETKILSG